MNYRNHQMVEYYDKSEAFRVMINNDPLLRACFNSGLDPLQTIIHLANRAESLHKQALELCENGLPPVYIKITNEKALTLPCLEVEE